MTFHLAHFSDNHLGFERHSARDAKGRNQRGVDVAAAWLITCQRIHESNLPLTVNSGDLFDSSHVDDNNYGAAARAGFQLLTAKRADGTRRQMVVISGNHDTPRRKNEVGPLEFWRGIPGLHIVTLGYQQITFDPDKDECDPALANVVVHAVPHDTLRDTELLATVQPVPGKRNILVTHGVAEGSDLFERSIGREFAIPADLMARGWDYVALGHWHVQGPVIPGKFGTQPGERSKIWYAGSTEITSLGDCDGPITRDRGWLEVRVDGTGGIPDVTQHRIPIRPHLRLPAIDASAMTPEEVSAALVANLDGIDIDGSCIYQTVQGAGREMWSIVDTTTARAVAEGAVHYEITARHTAPKKTKDELAAGEDDLEPTVARVAHLDSLLEELAEKILNPAFRDDSLAMARKLLAGAFGGDGPTETIEASDSTAA